MPRVIPVIGMVNKNNNGFIVLFKINIIRVAVIPYRYK